MDFKKTLILTASIAIISGCSLTPDPKDDEQAITAYEQAILEEYRRTNEVLAKAALLSSKSLAVYVRTHQAMARQELTSEQVRLARWENNYIPVNMEQKVPIGWDSAPEPLMKSLAMLAGYELEFANQRPPISKSVTTDNQPRMIKNFFKAIMQQTSGYIDRIDVDDKSDMKKITVYYSEF